MIQGANDEQTRGEPGKQQAGEHVAKGRRVSKRKGEVANEKSKKKRRRKKVAIYNSKA